MFSISPTPLVLHTHKTHTRHTRTVECDGEGDLRRDVCEFTARPLARIADLIAKALGQRDALTQGLKENKRNGPLG